MLKVLFGKELHPLLRYIDDFFKVVFQPEWLDDELVKEMIEDIDKSKVLSRYCIESPVLGQIPPTMLSGGVKALIILLKDEPGVDEEECYLNLTYLGNNCQKWLLRIAEEKDIEVCMTGYEMDFYGFEDMNVLCLNDGSIIHNGKEWVDKMIDYGEMYYEG